jgi:hypothetical protein
VSARTATTITCSCPLSSQRRLQQSSADATDDSEVPAEASVSYVAMLTEVQDNFVGTVISAQGLNASTVEKGWSALVTIGSFAAAILAALYWSHQADAQMDKVKPDLSEKKIDRGLSRSVSIFGRFDRILQFFSRTSTRNLRSARATLCISKDVLIAEQALPAILSSNTLTNRVKDELKHHHKWFGIVFFFSRSFPRVLRVMSLATNVIIMLFIQSITYALTNPDDGTCESLNTEEACLGPSSPYTTGESKCRWMTNASECVLVQPDSNVKVILFVAIFSALLCTPLALLVDWIIMYVLSAPTKRVSTAPPVTAIVTADVGNVRSRHRSQATEFADATAVVPTAAAATQPSDRKRSSLSRSIFGSVFGVTPEGSQLAQSVSLSAQSDLRKLVQALTAYRAQLNEQQRGEFDGKWPVCSYSFVSLQMGFTHFFPLLVSISSHLGSR